MHSKPEIQDRQSGDSMMRKLSEGAESHVYAVRYIGIDCILKRRIEKRYRVKSLDESLRTQRTKKEAKIMSIASSFGVRTPTLLLVDRYDILMSRIDGRNLHDILIKGNKSTNIMRVFKTLGKYAATLHNNGITHGDYTPANIIIGRNKVVYIIDFGLSEMSDSIEEMALDLLLMKRSVDKNNFTEFMNGYTRNSSNCKTVKNRLKEIERRGRYNTRTLAVNQRINLIS